MSTRSKTLLCAILCFLFISSTWTSVHAQNAPTARQKQRARTHYDRAISYHDRGKYRKAIEEYQRAYELSKAPKLLFNIAQAYRLIGDTASALKYYERYLALEPRGTISDTARDQSAQMRKEIEAAVAARRAEDERKAEQARKAERARKAEQERIAALASKAEQDRQSEREREAKELRAAEQARLRLVTKTAGSAPAPSPVAEAPRRPSRGRMMRIAGIALGGTGLLAMGVGIQYSNEASNISDELSNVTWSNELKDRIDQGQDAERNAIISYSIAATTIAAGGALYYLGWRSSSKEAARAIAIVPAVNQTSSGITLSGNF